MIKGIIACFEEFQKNLPQNFIAKADAERIEALKHYFSIGGVVSISPNGLGWPSLVYPNKRQLQNRLDAVTATKQSCEEKIRQWQAKHTEAKMYNIVQNIKKLREPLYWQHVIKTATDADYRTDVGKVKLPVHLVSDPRWKPMVKMFVSDLEYRKQLAETVETSIVYRKDKRVAKYAGVLQDFRKTQSEKKINELSEVLSKLEQNEKTINVLMKWAAP